MSGKIIEFYGSPALIAAKKTELLSKYLEGDLRGFTGTVISYDVNYNYMHGQVFDNGHRSNAMPKLGYKVSRENGQISGGRTLDGQWFDVYLVHYWSDGSSDWSYLYSYCIGCGGGGGENPGGGSTGDQGGTSPVVNANYVFNNVTDPCISQQIAKALASNLTNKISTLINQTFNVDNFYNITFGQGSFPYELDAATTVSNIGPSTLSIATYFNENTLPYASQEYIVATVYHEVLHAALLYDGLVGAEAHEETIANGYIDRLTSALLENFPGLSADEARRLSWGGLEWTKAYNNLSTAEKAAIEDVNENHKNNISGTGCD